MDDAPRAGPYLDCLNPLVFGEISRRFEELVRDRAGLLYFELSWHADDGVGCADFPTLDKLRRWRQIFRIAFRRSAVRPTDKSFLVFLAQPPIV